MFEPVLETGDIIQVNHKKYLVLGIYNHLILNIQQERVTYVDKVLRDVENKSKPKPFGTYEAIRNMYYYFLYYDSKTVKEFLTRILGQNNCLLVCEYSSYPASMKLESLYKIKGKLKKVENLKEEDVKLNLVKDAFLDKSFANISTTTEVYNRVFSDVKDSPITKQQKEYLKKCVMEQLNFIAEEYYKAKYMQSDCIAEVCINNKHYLGYIGFTEDHVNVFNICNKNARLRKKVELLFSDNYNQKLKLDFKDVAKVEF